MEEDADEEETQKAFSLSELCYEGEHEGAIYIEETPSTSSRASLVELEDTPASTVTVGDETQEELVIVHIRAAPATASPLSVAALSAAARQPDSRSTGCRSAPISPERGEKPALGTLPAEPAPLVGRREPLYRLLGAEGLPAPGAGAAEAGDVDEFSREFKRRLLYFKERGAQRRVPAV